ncbi:MFS transporter [Leifsonia poae]|uniref:MFS transporter n=1 Tax=Leifsonia poae TaxID=110933 RepID=UPI001CBCB502|nr:MFS transporter [Leifsonia poae]
MLTPDAGSQARGLRPALVGLLALTAGSFFAVTTEVLPVGLLPAIGRAFSVSESIAGLLVSVYAVAVAVLAVPLTVLTRRYPRKAMLLCTLTLYVVSNALVAVAPNFAVVAVGRALGGISHALFFSVCIGYSARLVDREFIGRAMALVAGGISGGLILGVPLLTSLGTVLGWRSAFGALAILTALTTVGIAVVLPGVGNENPPPGNGTHQGRRRLVAVVTANGVAYLGQFVLYTYIAVVLLGAGSADAAIGPLLIGIGACGLLGLWFGAATFDRSPRWSGVAVIGVAALGMIGVGLGYPSFVAVLLAAAVWSAAYGAAPSFFQAASVRTHATSPEIAGAWVNTTSNIGIAGGAAIGAVTLDAAGAGALPWVGAALMVVALAITATARGAFPSRL